MFDGFRDKKLDIHLGYTRTLDSYVECDLTQGEALVILVSSRQADTYFLVQTTEHLLNHEWFGKLYAGGNLQAQMWTGATEGWTAFRKPTPCSLWERSCPCGFALLIRSTLREEKSDNLP